MSIKDILDQIDAQEDRRKQEREAQSRATNILENPIVKALGAGLIGYGTGGLAKMALDMIPGVGAGAGAATAAETAKDVATGASGLSQATGMIPRVGQAIAPTVGAGVSALKAPSAISQIGSTIAGAFTPTTENVSSGLGAMIAALKGGEPVASGLESGITGPMETLKQRKTAEMASKLGLPAKSMTKGEVSYERLDPYAAALKEAQLKNIASLIKTRGVGKGPVSLGKLSNAGAGAFSAAQAAINNGKDSATVIQAINGATDIPTNEKPIIIKNLKAGKTSNRKI